MNFFNTIAVGFKEVWAHKFRSMLTMLGIILGVASLVAMSALVKGMENGMRETMVAMGGADKVLIEEQSVPAYQEHRADEASGRTLFDVEALRRNAPMVKLISPEMDVRSAILTRGEKMVNPSECVGVWPEVLEMNLHSLGHGRFFTALDEESASSVCVIGTGIRDELFGAPEKVGYEIVPVGELIQLNGQTFTIVGMLDHYEGEQEKKERELAKKVADETKSGPTRMKGWGRRGGWAFWRKNYTLFMPLNTAWLRFRASTGTNNVPDPRLSDIDVKVADFESLESSIQQARNVLMMTHKGLEDFNFRTQENQLDSINLQIKNARLSGGIIAGISLLVGGIGIMNIMLASVLEQTREIGVRRAVGARRADIRFQFLVTAFSLAMIGGLLGVAIGLGIARAVAAYADWPTVVTTWSVALSLGVSVLVGVGSGLYPAVRAARLDPIQALHSE